MVVPFCFCENYYKLAAGVPLLPENWPSIGHSHGTGLSAGLADKMAVAGYTRCAGKLGSHCGPTAGQLVWAFFAMI
jgi:hypothetical protein